MTARDEHGIEYMSCGRQLHHITADVQVTFIALRYRLVFILDVSPSIATVVSSVVQCICMIGDVDMIRSTWLHTVVTEQDD